MSIKPRRFRTLRTNKEYLATAERIIKLNEHQPDRLYCLGVNCGSTSCYHCPLTHAFETNRMAENRLTYRTLGDLRRAVETIKNLREMTK